MKTKTTPAQQRARKKLTVASHKAKMEYDKLPQNQKTRKTWHALVRKHLNAIK